MRTRPDQTNDNELQAPEGLADDLRGEYGRHIEVPAQVDETVLRMAQLRFARRRRPIVVLRWAAAGAAAAGLILGVAVLLGRSGVGVSHGSAAVTPAAMREDVDRNGRVDILDAFALARHIEAPQKPNMNWDVTGDGVVNQADVDRIAMAAVSLSVEKEGTLQ